MSISPLFLKDTFVFDFIEVWLIYNIVLRVFFTEYRILG